MWRAGAGCAVLGVVDFTRGCPLDERLDELVGGGRLGLVDCLAAGGAVPAGLERRPACGVRQGLAVGAAAAAPVGEQAERAGKPRPLSVNSYWKRRGRSL